jgi:hypothetical protein
MFKVENHSGLFFFLKMLEKWKEMETEHKSKE